MINSTLTSDRLQIRLIAHSDLEFIHGLLSRPETDQFNALGTPESIVKKEIGYTAKYLKLEL